MKEGNCLYNLTYKNIYLLRDFNDFTQKICQKLPFSNILLLATDSEFFELGAPIFNQLIRNGVKVQTVIIKEKNFAQLDDFFKAKNLFLEFRGVIVFNKWILKYLQNSSAIFFKIFYMQRGGDIYGIFNCENKESSFEYNFFLANIDKTILLKNFLIRTLDLIDYLICNALSEKEVDRLFFSKVKRLIVCAVTTYTKSQENLERLFNLLIILEKTFAKKEGHYFSANVVCYLMQKEYYDLEMNFVASKKIVKRYNEMLLNKSEHHLSFSERARLVSLFSKEKINTCLNSICKQLEKIKDNFYEVDKEEIKSLLKIYTKLLSEIEKDSCTDIKEDKHSRLYNHKLDECVNVCGDTKLSINGMTLARQVSFIKEV